jgi:2-methylcitrate dehydratase PrpD
MAQTIVEQLAAFAAEVTYESLPEPVVAECKRILLDSLGCALAAVDQPKGRIGIDYGRIVGSGKSEATIIGTAEPVSILGAAFANGELINALDFDAILPPGHVVPYVLPGALAVAEQRELSGKDLIAALAVAHEMSLRIGKAMDNYRHIQNGEVVLAPVLGFASTIFGASAAIGKLQADDAGTLAHALGIAANVSPVNTMRSWLQHAPSTTLKYTLAGLLTQSALTATYMAELGHRGDLQVLDDANFGYPRFIGSERWEPAGILEGLGSDWHFPSEQTYKPYPHCRILHGLLDILIDLVEENDIRPEEIEEIRAQGEAWVHHPVWQNRIIEHVGDAQFSIAHGLAVGAHRVQPSAAWQSPELVFSESVLGLMEKVSFESHPDWIPLYSQNAVSRPSQIDIRARGQVFTAHGSFPHGTPSPDPSTTMSTEELVRKFRVNAALLLDEAQSDAMVDAVLALEDENVAEVMRGVRPVERKMPASV